MTEDEIDGWHHRLIGHEFEQAPRVDDASSHLIICCPLLLLPPNPPSIRVFSNESTLHMRWPKYWSFSFSISPSKEYPGLISLKWTGWTSLQSKGLSKVFSNTRVQKHQFFGTLHSFLLKCYLLRRPFPDHLC